MKPFILLFLFLIFFVPCVSFAHTGAEDPTGVHHMEDDVAQVSPAVAIGGIGAVAIGGFAVWWFLLRKK